MKKILVSACLMGENCKYNGGNNFSLKLEKYIKEHGHEVVSICPEVFGGLTIPRIPAEILIQILEIWHLPSYNKTLCT